MSKEKEYAVDSTRGHSLINPLNYKGDVLVQVWVDSRVLATLTRWMDSKGTFPRFMSQAVKRPLEVLVDFLVDQGEVELVDGTAEARAMLTRRFNVDLNRGGRGEKNVVHNLALSDRRGELGERIRAERKLDDVGRPRHSNRSPLLAEAERIYDSLPITRKSTIFDKEEKGEERIISPKELNEIVHRQDNGELSPLREDATPEEIAEHIKKADQEEQRKLDELNNLDLDSLVGTR